MEVLGLAPLCILTEAFKRRTAGLDSAAAAECQELDELRRLRGGPNMIIDCRSRGSAETRRGTCKGFTQQVPARRRRERVRECSSLDPSCQCKGLLHVAALSGSTVAFKFLHYTPHPSRGL
eukprot:951484-Rhodomonas_salina.2